MLKNLIYCSGFVGGLFISQNYRINEKIRAPKILLIGDEGQNLGVLEIAEALKLAEDAETDLVEVSPEADPPVCRLLDYGKLKYQQKKKSNQKQKKAPQQKEIRIRPKIGEHDKQVKIKQIRQFIEDGDKVLVSLNFRGREMAHMENAQQIMDEWSAAMTDIAKIEKPAKFEGRRMVMVLTAK